MITTSMIIREVARFYHLPIERMVSEDRSSVVHLPRRMSWRLARDLTSHSITGIGQRIGAVNHATVLHGLKRLEAQMAGDEQIVDAHAHLVEMVKIRAAENLPAGTREDRSAIEIATAMLAGSIATTEPTVRELRVLCETVCGFADRIVELSKVDVLHNLDLAESLAAKTAEVEAASAIIAAARRVSVTARAVAADIHTIRERGSRMQHEAALTALQNLFERT